MILDFKSLLLPYLSIQMKQMGEKYYIKVEDDGKGIDI